MKDIVNKGTVWVITKEYREWDMDTTTILDVWEVEPPNEYVKELKFKYGGPYYINVEEVDFYGIGGDK